MMSEASGTANLHFWPVAQQRDQPKKRTAPLPRSVSMPFGLRTIARDGASAGEARRKELDASANHLRELTFAKLRFEVN
jgi:hypothetical protein